MIVNRIGDAGLAVSLCLIFLTFKSFDYATVFALAPKAVDVYTFFEIKRLTLITFLLF
jgi:NADH:ubiquinone oxidoreductase subunit 5 (subunit L)/multisubunit Na+/H+ antiporter MnhA subunit